MTSLFIFFCLLCGSVLGLYLSEIGPLPPHCPFCWLRAASWRLMCRAGAARIPYSAQDTPTPRPAEKNELAPEVSAKVESLICSNLGSSSCCLSPLSPLSHQSPHTALPQSVSAPLKTKSGFFVSQVVDLGLPRNLTSHPRRVY